MSPIGPDPRLLSGRAPASTPSSAGPGTNFAPVQLPVIIHANPTKYTVLQLHSEEEGPGGDVPGAGCPSYLRRCAKEDPVFHTSAGRCRRSSPQRRHPRRDHRRRSRCPPLRRNRRRSRPLLENRQRGKLKGPNWYGLSFSSSLKMFSARKIVTSTLARRNAFSIDGEASIFLQGAGGGCGIFVCAAQSIGYVLGVLNSNLLTFYFQRIRACANRRATFRTWQLLSALHGLLATS